MRYKTDDEYKKELANRNIRMRFNGLRDRRLEIDSYSCQRCGSEDNLVVHHLERRADRNVKDSDSKIDDLLTLCRACHITIHREAGDLG
jgi:5-methylcytosine-specific restriction endonuclease McrA